MPRVAGESTNSAMRPILFSFKPDQRLTLGVLPAQRTADLSDLDGLALFLFVVPAFIVHSRGLSRPPAR